uniref:Transmembrane protein n=1 Tax=Sinocyclocheilus grahami TaxID=75366 RepID=A0A672L4C3_SINGR
MPAAAWPYAVHFAISCFCFFFIVFRSRDSVLFDHASPLNCHFSFYTFLLYFPAFHFKSFLSADVSNVICLFSSAIDLSLGLSVFSSLFSHLLCVYSALAEASALQTVSEQVQAHDSGQLPVVREEDEPANPVT